MLSQRFYLVKEKIRAFAFMLKKVYGKINEDKINEILDYLYNLCKENITFEDILKNVFDNYALVMNATQYVLISSAIKSYLSYLKDQNKLTYEFIDNKMYWKQS